MTIVCSAGTALAALFVLAQLRFLILMLLPRYNPELPPPLPTAPLVAIQIATYRESAALPLVLKAISELDWPRQSMLVQILDDSPAIEAALTKAVVAQYANEGLPVSYHNRDSRLGFKAGALNLGLAIAAPAEFIAYFDADCRPTREFLRCATAMLSKSDVAAVQARWRYPNADASPLTALQAAAFEYLFRYEYEARGIAGLPVYYLGSSALWRREALVALGGWRFQPFTAEDVDMSNRAAAAGWQVLYHPQVLGEDDALEDVLAFRAQQRRWAQSVLRAGVDAAPGLARLRRGPLTRLLEWSSLAPHATIIVVLLLTVCLSGWTLAGYPPKPVLFWTFSVLMIVSPATLALAAAQAAYHGSGAARRVALLLLAGPFAAATMTSFVFGVSDFLIKNRLEFVATPKAGQVGVIGGRHSAWLHAQIAPLALDVCLAGLFTTSFFVAVFSQIWSAIWPLALMAGAFASSGLICGFALIKRVMAK
ncbi:MULTISPECIES: glycosyltransferase family 2 protein [unclassified Mesorhizobium]|uniref:glycosyltransferase family 2 protein n=1 Tax=unclassified Mesorhizobium TaxID=325217 RepID=UPI00333C00CF